VVVDRVVKELGIVKEAGVLTVVELPTGVQGEAALYSHYPRVDMDVTSANT
jgi:hypothetical protein